MEIAKALILAGGSRHGGWSIGHSGPRHLFPVANRPILFHNLEALRAAGILEAAILAEAAALDAIRDAVGHGASWGLSIDYRVWDASGGLPSALAVARDFVAEEPILVEEGDALLRERVHAHIATFARDRLDTLALSLQRARTPLTPSYLLSPWAVSVLSAEADSTADPVLRLQERGGRVRVQDVEGCLPCHGDLDALLDSNRCVLETLALAAQAPSLDRCTVQGRVHVDPSARIRRTVLRGPVVVGAGAQIVDAYIGPYTSVGADVAVEGAEIEHSIVLPGAQLRYIGARLESSVIGRGARVVRGFGMPSGMQMSIGDGAEVTLR